jgi:hypothetical protein
MTIVKSVFAMTQMYHVKKYVTQGTHDAITKHVAIITFFSHFSAQPLTVSPEHPKEKTMALRMKP